MRKPNGMRPRRLPPSVPPRPVPTPSARSLPSPSPRRSLHLRPLLAVGGPLLASSLLLAGCATTATTATTAKAQCAAWRAITYASKHDTADTVRQVRVHNRTGRKIGCWP